MGVAPCKPVSDQILYIYAHTKQARGVAPIYQQTPKEIYKSGHGSWKCALASLHLHIAQLLILHGNTGQSLITFKVGLTQMTWTKRDLVDPTQFQRCPVPYAMQL